MKIRIPVFLVVLLCLFALSSASAQDNDDYVYDGTIKFVVPDLPRFEEYSDVKYATRRAEDIDWASARDMEGYHNLYPRFKEKIEKKFRDSAPNCAGKYVLIFQQTTMAWGAMVVN